MDRQRGHEVVLDEQTVAQINANPEYIMMRRKRNSLGVTLTVIILVLYYGYVSLIAFNKEFLGTRIGEGVTTIGVPIGLGLIVTVIVLTAYYVWQANRSFDSLVAKIKAEVDHD